MKNNINTITWIFFMLFSFLTFGQTEELEYFRGDEFQYFDRIQDLKAPLGRNGELEDFSFTWGNNSFTVAIHNRAVLHEAQINAQRDRWYRRQLDLIKKHLEKKYNRSYTSYDEAKNDVFLRTERDHIYRNSRAPRSKYYRLINDGEKKVTYNIGNLKAFEIRRAEIQSGNIHNSGIPFMYINGTSLADITSVSVLNNYTATHTDYLKFLISEKHVNTTIVRKIEALPGDVNFESYVLNLKNDYYNGFNDWDRLNLMQFFLNYEHIKKYLSPPYILPTQFSSFYGIDKATPTNIEDYARRNRGGGQHLLANKCRIYVPGPQPTYMDIPTCLEAQRNYIDKLLNSTNSLDALAEKAIQGLGTRNVNFLNARPDLKQQVIDYFKANNFSRFSHNGINWLLNRFQDTNTLPLDANLLKSATTPLFQDATNPDRALQISFNQQAITEGITNFGNVLAELLKDNVNVAFEGSVIRAFFEANEFNINASVTNAYLGNTFKFVSNDGSFLRIDFEDLVLRDEFITIRNHISSVRLDRFIEFKELIANDCSALVDIDCDQIVHWQNLAQHQAPQSVVEKIKSLPSGTFNDFYIQELENANGTMVNMDYFGVNIVTLPINLSTGQRFTPDELLDYMRRDFNNFVSGSTFAPYCQIQSICAQETNLWNSNNPLGAMIYIDIPGDDGVVICTEYQNDYWYFQTMNAPYAGNHPVSGTRQFGYERLANGTYNFFVRGVDRIDSNIIENIAYFFTGGNPLIGADNLWRSFQDKLQRFVDNNSGRAVGTSPIRNRPDWNKVKSVLKGEKPISDLGCN